MANGLQHADGQNVFGNDGNVDLTLFAIGWNLFISLGACGQE